MITAPPSVLENKKSFRRLLYEIMAESLSEEPWLLLLARTAHFTSAFSIVLITELSKLSFRPLDHFQRTIFISSLLNLSEKDVRRKTMSFAYALLALVAN